MGKRQSPGQKAWAQGGLKLVGSVALKHYRMYVLPHLPRCGAKTKSTEDGRPCRQLALENGRCRYHGGRVSKGSGWHRHQFPKKAGPDAEKKFARKVKQVERDQRAQAKRRRNMTPEQLERYERWHRDRPLGPPVKRAMRRADRQMAADFQRASERLVPVSPELAALQAERQRIEAERDAFLNSMEDRGVFG